MVLIQVEVDIMNYDDIANQIVNEIKSNILTIYHGSDHIVNKLVFGNGKRNNDYGLAFYTTENIDLAKEWAALYCSYQHCYLNTYTIYTNDLNVLRLNDEDYLEWLAISINNRKPDALVNTNDDIVLECIRILNETKYIDISKYDCIVGWIADDSYFSFVEDYVFNRITTDVFIKAIKLGGLGSQFACISKKAFEHIGFVKAEPVNYSMWLKKAEERDRNARNNYSRLRSNQSIFSCKRFMDEIESLIKEG